MGIKVAYVTESDDAEIHNWSGTTFYIKQALTRNGIEIIPIRNLKEGPYHLITRTKRFIYRRFFSKLFLRNFDRSLLNYYGKQVAAYLSNIEYDAVLAAGPGEKLIACLRTDRPVIIWTDATFASLVDFYPDFKNLCKETLKDGNDLQQRLLSKCRLALFSSDWAANSALEHYDLDPAKVKVVPYGANIECDRDIPAIQKILSAKKFDTCKLLFVGVEWSRKGGDIAVQVAERLNRQGLKTELHVVGYRPPGEVPDHVKSHGFVSKSTEEGRKKLSDLFKESHFFILPSRAECCAVVFAEASSFGLPSLATDVGGITTAIHNCKNGQTFSPVDGPEKYCDYIMRLMSDQQEYERLSLSSFREYTERLNWEIAGQKASELIRESCGK